MNKEEKSWFRPRAYVHLTRKLTYKDERFVRSKASNSSYVERHAFYPLIHRIKAHRRYKKLPFQNQGKKRGHFYFENGDLVHNKKERHLFYSNHLDTHIYAYYASSEKLGGCYESYLKDHPGLSECITAYRKIPVTKHPSCQTHKSNIHFAKEVFDHIYQQEYCVALAFDIEKFFDSLDHKYLKKSWKRVLSEETEEGFLTSLPKDYYNIYRSLTRFSYVDFEDLMREFEIKHANDLKRKDARSYCSSNKEFRKRIIEKGFVKFNPNRNPEGKRIGIPQGTPISALLANIYLLEFDEFVYEEVVVKRKSFYRRYSDDIVIVCPPYLKHEITCLIVNKIKEFRLQINEEKKEESHFYDNPVGKLSSKYPFRYLGFEFDGQKIRLKSSSLARFYRKMKTAVRARAWRANRSRSKSPDKNSKIFRSKLYKNYSHLRGKAYFKNSNIYMGNFITYANKAHRIMGERSAIRNQVKRHWKVLNQEILDYEWEYQIGRFEDDITWYNYAQENCCRLIHRLKYRKKRRGRLMIKGLKAIYFGDNMK